MNPDNDKSIYSYGPFGQKITYYFATRRCNCETWRKSPIRLTMWCTCGQLNLCIHCILNRFENQDPDLHG